ncbi:MAG: Rho termination factor N-terminal domain-containing protein [Proteobacteria bacterium]|nr:Rho termination factor N-terminal domain-containing protein [Pseudomonadota bacterium]
MSREELEKLTATKLREIAHEYSDIQGAHAMKKEELIVAILKARGEPIKVAKKKPTQIHEIKKHIRELKAEKQKLLEAKDLKKLGQIRKQIKRKLHRES